MFVTGDINDLWDLTGFAWRPVGAWDPKVVLSKFLSNDNDLISCPSGGLVVYDSDSLKKANLSKDSINRIFRKVVNFRMGGVEERALGLLAYENKIQVNLLNMDYNYPALNKYSQSAKIIHFLGDGPVKPWQDVRTLYAFPEWAVNHKKFLMLKNDKKALSEFEYIFNREKLLTQNFATPALLDIIHSLNVIKDPSFNFLLLKPYNSVRFFISSVPHNIYYECVTKSNLRNECEIYLRIENGGFFNLVNVDKLKENLLEQVFGKPFNWNIWKNNNKLELYITTSTSLASMTLDNLIKQTKNYILKNFGGNGDA